ncbi:MAG TPA: TonB-dependent receptor, partial [Thiotrichaceae bacterium]|nr:TonB-dependent receptor [Thiotrichaceae bacterium]
GVDLRERGTFGVQGDLSIRGANFSQVLILINGIKVYDPQTAHHNLDIPVSLSDVERIEILNGHGSSIYGENAFGGVINIVTNKSVTKKFSGA